MAAPGSLQGPARPPAGPARRLQNSRHSLRKEPISTLHSLLHSRGNHIPREAAGSALASLAARHRAQMERPLPPPAQRYSPTPEAPLSLQGPQNAVEGDHRLASSRGVAKAGWGLWCQGAGAPQCQKKTVRLGNTELRGDST